MLFKIQTDWHFDIIHLLQGLVRLDACEIRALPEILNNLHELVRFHLQSR